MSQDVAWLKLPRSDGRGLELAEGRVIWVSMTEGLSRWAVGVSEKGLTFETPRRGPSIVDTPTGSGRPRRAYTLVLALPEAGTGQDRRPPRQVGRRLAGGDVFPLTKVQLVARNVVGPDGKLRGTQAKHAKAMVPLLDRLFVSQGGFSFGITQGKDVELTSFSLVSPRGERGPLLVDARSPAQIKEVFKGHVSTAAAFTIFFCSALYGAPCAAGLASGPIILIDESQQPSGKKGRDESLAEVVGHELAHAMGHTESRFGRSHSKRKDNLMYESTDGGSHLGATRSGTSPIASTGISSTPPANPAPPSPAARRVIVYNSPCIDGIAGPRRIMAGAGSLAGRPAAGGAVLSGPAQLRASPRRTPRSALIRLMVGSRVSSWGGRPPGMARARPHRPSGSRPGGRPSRTSR